jgi:hypothetical protein
MINVVIFSKDRAAQLELLLRSFKQFFREWSSLNVSVVYKASTFDFEKGYDLCINNHPEFTYVNEDLQSFKDATLASVKHENPFTFFLVDDIVFKEPISMLDPEFEHFSQSADSICLSLRLHAGINYCYPIAQYVPPPMEITEGKNEWSWLGEQGDWGYPLSVDGHVFSTEMIRLFIDQLPYTNPNTFESYMAFNAQDLAPHFPKMICYKKNSRILNIPANRVQDTFANRVGNLITAEDLNKKFLQGNRIKLEPFVGYVNNSAHIELPYEFEENK